MIEWHLEKRLVSSLKEHPRNPRRLSVHDAQHLKQSLEKFGIIDKPVITPDGQLIGGHQRKRILASLKIKEIDCWVPDRPLTNEEVDELNIRLNRTQGEWNDDIIANEWNVDDLIQWGFKPQELFAIHEEQEDELEPKAKKPKKVLVCPSCGVSIPT